VNILSSEDLNTEAQRYKLGFRKSEGRETGSSETESGIEVGGEIGRGDR
jgi:hypothetical protein